MLIEDRDNSLIHPESMPKSWHGMSNSSSSVKRIRMEAALVFVFPPDSLKALIPIKTMMINVNPPQILSQIFRQKGCVRNCTLF